MVARLTLAQIARVLEVDEHTAHGVLNRLGVESPADGEATLILLRDLQRARDDLQNRKPVQAPPDGRREQRR